MFESLNENNHNQMKEELGANVRLTIAPSLNTPHSVAVDGKVNSQ